MAWINTNYIFPFYIETTITARLNNQGSSW